MNEEPSHAVKETNGFMVVNEFAAVRVRKMRTRNGERLEISSPLWENSIKLDALALEALTWQSPETISKFLENPFGPADPLDNGQ
jgi:hypothetical protein